MNRIPKKRPVAILGLASERLPTSLVQHTRRDASGDGKHLGQDSSRRRSRNGPQKPRYSTRWQTALKVSTTHDLAAPKLGTLQRPWHPNRGGPSLTRG